MDAKELLSRRYATAFLAVFGNILTLEEMNRLAQVRAFLEDNQSSLVALKIPTISASSKRDMLATLFAHYGLVGAWSLLVDLLLKDRRLFLLVPVLASAIRLYLQSHDMVQCTISSSYPLSDQQKQSIVHFIERMTGKKIISTYAVDATLIAGISIQSETFFWEHSVRRQLQRLKEPLILKGYYEY